MALRKTWRLAWRIWETPGRKGEKILDARSSGFARLRPDKASGMTELVTYVLGQGEPGLAAPHGPRLPYRTSTVIPGSIGNPSSFVREILDAGPSGLARLGPDK